MQLTLKQRWREIMRGQPGRRFKERYVAAKESRADASWAQRGRRVLRILAAMLATGIGVIFAFIPGPATPFFFLAGALLASESLYLARLMDWGEVRLRRLWGWGKHHWGQTPAWRRAVLVTLGLCLSATSTYLSYRLATR